MKKLFKITTITRAIALYFTVSTSFIAASKSFSAPDITTATLVNDVLQIRGNGFGSHNDYGGEDQFLNYIFEDCEEGVITKTPKWSVDGGGGWAKIDNNENRIGSKYNLHNERRQDEISYTNAFGEEVTSSYRYGIKTNVENIAPVHRYFYSMWIMFSDNFGLIQNISDGTGAKFMMNTPFDDTGKKDYFSTGRSTKYGFVSTKVPNAT